MALVIEEQEVERIRNAQKQYPSRKFTDAAFPCSDHAVFFDVSAAWAGSRANVRSRVRRSISAA